MNLNDYFDPVSLEKTSVDILIPKKEFGRNIFVHTTNGEIKEIENFDIALIGVPEDRNSGNIGSALAPDKIRQYLYKLYKPWKKTRIIDLGNLKKGPSAEDSYFGLRDVLFELFSKNLIPVIVGGSQDITYGALLAYENLQKPINLVSIDSKIDFRAKSKKMSSENYLQHIINQKTKYLSCYSNIGHQVYFTDPADLELLKNLYFDTIRLGEARSDLRNLEPVLRDADLISLDMSAVRQSDAPGHYYPSPNGFYGEEICQIAKYAGISDQLSAFILSEINPQFDHNNQSAHLGAQVLWYFIDGFSQKKIEKPGDSEDFTKYIVSLDSIEQDLAFYKSEQTDRWWIEIPFLKKKNKPALLISCSYQDYLNAGKQEIPDRWWKAFQRIN
ncbi:MAG: formimidoylglutamase [Bacteroidota bacterium]|nr:formimidoylglutamase [Bacteroidota bacterium]